MKKITLLFTMLVMALMGVSADGIENFETANLPSSYSTSSFVNNGITWSYVASRDDAGYAIDSESLMLRRTSDSSRVSSSSISGGISSFSCKLKKAFTGSGNRQVELFINGVSKGKSIAWDNDVIQTFTVNDINVEDAFTIEIKNATSKQVCIDDISWTSYSAGGPTSPTITDESPATQSSFELGVPFDVSATVETQDAAGLDSVCVAYGQSADALNDTIKCSNIGNSYSVEREFVALDTIFYQIIAFGSNGTVKTSSVLKLYGVCGTVEAPVAIAATAGTPTSFTANWNASASAQGYLLDVWTETAATVVATDLFISEYAEGSSNNKYLEIYNGTGAVVDLGNYSLANASNGSDGTPEYWWDFPSVNLAVGEVYVICDPNAADAIKAEYDTTKTYLSNGNDGYALVKRSMDTTYIDWVGDFGADPGSGWTVAGIANATKDHTLVRKSTVSSGNTWANSVGTDADDSEWIVNSSDDWTGLGAHTMDGAASIVYVLQGDSVSGTSKLVEGLTAATTYKYAVSAYNSYGCESDKSNEISYETPVATQLQEVVSDVNVYTSLGQIKVIGVELEEVSIYDIAGRMVTQQQVAGEASIAVKSGIYIVRVADTLTKVVVR